MDLAYFVAVGMRRFRWAAGWAIKSLRGAGQFSGDIVVVSDVPYEFPCGARTIVVNDADVLAKPNWMKMRIRNHVDLTKYERVMFLDSDVAVARPLDDFLELTTFSQTTTATDDMLHNIGQGFTYRCLEEVEIEENSERRAVNAGFYVMPGPLAPAWLVAWEEMQKATLKRPGPGWCQPGLNACMVRGLIPITLIERRMWFPGRDPNKERCVPDPQLIHFHGIGRHLGRWWKMRQYVRKYLEKPPLVK